MVAGILGGSGTHVVQIIIGIVVAAALIGYFLLRAGNRGGDGHVRVASGVVRQTDGDTDPAHEEATNDATVRLARTWGISIGAQREDWDIAIDGIVVGSITSKETVEVAVAPGHHTLRLGSGRHRSAERSFDVAQDEVAAFSCYGPRFWPQLLAALVKNDLWITLRPA
ncbi:MAG: hypothetical protein WB793_01280 [Candidatus Dormiibacterota bacterium]